MFQNTSQLHAAMKEILMLFCHGDDISSLYPRYEGLEADLVEAINTCLDKGYLTGVLCTVSGDGEISISIPEPHVTAAGMNFISGN